jgi:Zn-dependent oligopeptidase
VPATTTTAPIPPATGYFAQASSLPFHAPDFTKIKDADLQPAIEQGIAVTRAEIAAIADNPAPPTFDNTLVALERSGQMLDRANAVLNQLTSANTNDTLDAAQTALAPQLTALSDDIYLNDKLFEASVNRTSGGDQYDLTGLVEELADLRARRAALLGQPNHAAYAMYDRMVKDPQAAIRFMRDFVPAVASVSFCENCVSSSATRPFICLSCAFCSAVSSAPAWTKSA